MEKCNTFTSALHCLKSNCPNPGIPSGKSKWKSSIKHSFSVSLALFVFFSLSINLIAQPPTEGIKVAVQLPITNCTEYHVELNVDVLWQSLYPNTQVETCISESDQTVVILSIGASPIPLPKSQQVATIKIIESSGLICQSYRLLMDGGGTLSILDDI